MKEDLKQSFSQTADAVMGSLRPGEEAVLNLGAEDSHFLRFNSARIRQSGRVEDGDFTLQLMADGRSVIGGAPFLGNVEKDTGAALEMLGRLRAEAPALPVDPYLVHPSDNGALDESYDGNLPNPAEAADSILAPMQGMAPGHCSGFYASGLVVRGAANSAGTRHWFSTETFCLDYSIFEGEDRMVKGYFAGREWNQSAFTEKLSSDWRRLEDLRKASRKISPGSYRIYLGPMAVSALTGMFGWGALSEAALRQGRSALLKLTRGEAGLSPLFSFGEDFSLGLAPRFNSNGEVSPGKLPLIDGGKLSSMLISSRTAKEYGITHNAAEDGEGPRAPRMGCGALKSGDILKEIGTGIYISNLHYLNWSDVAGGRVTGMTRYGCLWVENGAVVGPVENMRFDDTIYNLFGSGLAAVTDFSETIPSTDTYFQRGVGGAVMPGMVIEGMKFTL